jgi:hypothetical protein
MLSVRIQKCVRSGDSHLGTPQVHRVPVIVDEFVKRGGNTEELANLNQDLRQRYGADLSSVAWRWWVHVSLICCKQMLCVHLRPLRSAREHAQRVCTQRPVRVRHTQTYKRLIFIPFHEYSNWILLRKLKPHFIPIATPIKRH